MIRRIFLRARSERGFTLIELMIVVNVLGILMLVAIPSYLGLKDRATDNANKASLRTALGSINAYYQDNATFAGMSLAGLTAYDSALDVSKFTLSNVSATTYCIQTPQGSSAHVWRQNGPTASFERNNC